MSGGTDTMTATAVPQSGDGDHSESLVGKNKMQVKDIKSPKDLILWWWADKTGRLPIMIFLGVFILSLICMIIAMVDYNSVYVTGGLACLIIAFYGASHFKTLMALREAVEEYDRLNNNFRAENAKMRKELGKLQSATEELGKQEEKLEEVNRHSKENLEKFRTIEKNLQTIGASNVDGMKGVLSTLGSLNRRLTRNLSETERSLYLRVFDQMEFKDMDEGLTDVEYRDFLKALPTEHRKRLEEKTTFEQLAGDDGKIVVEEFSDFLDKMAGAQAAGARADANAL